MRRFITLKVEVDLEHPEEAQAKACNGCWRIQKRC